MVYLLIFYWVFAALFCFGAVYHRAESEEKNMKNMIGAFIGCLILGGIFFPMHIGRRFEL